MLMRSLSEPSLGTVGNFTVASTSRASRVNLHHETLPEKYRLRGQFFFEGKLAKIILPIVLAPWNVWWQSFIVMTTVYVYIVQFLKAYYLEESDRYLDTHLCNIFYSVDVILHFLHAYWPALRFHIRVFRRSQILVFYDSLSIIPLAVIFENSRSFGALVMIGRWLSIGRIYRLFLLYVNINQSMHKSRKLVLLIEHGVAVILFLHGFTCIWYSMNKKYFDIASHYYLGYPSSVGSEKLKFNTYTSCWYYCTCRLFNVIFGDSFPISSESKWLTSMIMILGFMFMRYHFIGVVTWDMVVESSRRLIFVDQYHHMLNYLLAAGAPASLVEQAKNYKLQLWRMKDGVLTSNHLQKLPLTLQMELIFDINVGHFHNTLLFRDIDEGFMRQISLLMRHELFLAGQHIWSQGVVKNGMICVKQGVIEMLSDEDDESPMIAFKSGTVLGELSLFYSIPAKVTVTAATYVELQVLRRTDFMRAMVELSSQLKGVREKIENRLTKAKKRQKAITEYDKSDSRLIRTRYRPMKVLKNNLAGVEEEDPTFVDDSHMYYKDENNFRQPKFTREFLELYKISNNVTSIDTPKICLRANFPWILEPNTEFIHMFELAHFAMVLYVCIVTPYVAILSVESYDWERVMSIVIIAGLILHIYQQLTTAIVDKNVIKIKVKDIAEVKMSSVGFYLDLVSVFPMCIFSDTLDPKAETAAGQVTQLCPILQVWHIWDYLAKWEKTFHSHPKVLCLLRYGLIFSIFSYWSGCALYLFSCPRQLCREGSWMSQLIFWETKVFVTIDAKHEKPQLSSLAFGTSVFTGSGSSDTAPGVLDLWPVVILIYIGAYLSCFYVAKICSLFMLAMQRNLRFKESMRELFYFLSVNHVSGKIKARVKKFFCVQWYYNNAVSVEELFKDMSTNIQQEVLAIETVETLLYCPLFQECSKDYLQTVAANTRPIVLPDNEVVQHAADIGRDVYIVQKGHCNILNHHGKIISSVGPGSQFGLIEMLYGLPKVYTVVTSTNCILLHVEYSAMVQSWSSFPDISNPIMKVLSNPELKSKAAEYDVAKPLTGRMDTKTNRIAQELKESFVVLTGREERAHYARSFQKLGVLRFIKYIILPGCITPHGIFLKFWCTLRLVLAFYYVLIIPYNIAIMQHKYGSTDYIPDFILYIDVVLMSYVAYYDNRSLLVTHPLFTISRYLKRGFLIDIVTVFPFEYLFKLLNNQTDISLCRVNKILQITRIIGAFSYLESDIMSVNQVVVLLKFLPLAFTLVNFATAFIFVNYCTSYMANDTIMANCTRTLILSGKNRSYQNAASEYAHTFLRAFEVFMGCGCTTVSTLNTVDSWLNMSLQISGFLYFAFMFGYVSSTRSAAAHALLEHTEKTSDLENFLYQENVEPILTTKTMKYFDYLWKRTHGSNPQQICRRLNSALMEDTLVFMYERTLREVPLFGKVERSFIRVITQHLHEMYFLKGETVIQCKDVQPYIYIIYRGKVDVMSSYNEMITCMGPGGMFGNFTGQPISCSDVSIYASRSLDLLVISSQTFFNLVKYYPKIQEPLNKAFMVSKDYILPISMVHMGDNSSSEESDADLASLESGFDSRSGSSRFEMGGQLSLRSSQSSMAKSSVSTVTFQTQIYNMYNLFVPGSSMSQAFGYLTCVIATVNYVLVLYMLITLNDCYFIIWTIAFFDIYFYINIYMSLHEGFPSKHGELIMDTNKCRRRYFRQKFRFYSDLLVNLPLEPFGFCFPAPVRAMHYLRVHKLLRVKYIVEFYKSTAAELTNNLTTLQSVMIILIVVFFVHSFTCLWLLLLIATSPVSVIRTLKTENIMAETPPSYWDYSTSFYIVVSELTTTGGDEHVVDQYVTIVILSFCLLLGKILAAIIVATAAQIAYSIKHALTSYEKVSGELIDVLKNQGLSDYQLKKLWLYVKQLWMTERGRQLPALLAQTPYVRRCDLMTAMFGQHLRNCYIFSDTGESFLRQLTVALDYTIFFPGNYIVVAGDSDARMHWVSAGTVSVVSVRADLTETTHELLGPGDVFGILQGLHRGVAHCFSYRAETKVSVLTLALDSWSHILPFFPEARKRIFERSEVLFSKI